MIKIVQKDNKTLRVVATDLPLEEIGSKKTQTLLKNMKEALDVCPDGAALAAPQIGVSLRIFVVSKKIFMDEEGVIPAEAKDLVFINPRLTKISKRQKKLDEGCLSVRGYFGEIERAEKATVEAYNEFGQKFSYAGAGLMAQIFQHELDHLEGILFIDKAKNLAKVD
ncbi:MAG: peptide deformylase [Candidatus Paceibacterota bacterium]|jgi:peptide deformylase